MRVSWGPQSKALLASGVLCVVRLATHFPQVRVEGLAAVGVVLLRLVRTLVSSDGGQVGSTVLNHCAYRGETLTRDDLQFVQRSRTLGFLPQEDTVTIGVLRRCRTVRTKQHFLTTVLGIRPRFTQCTGYRVNSGAPLYFCHVARAILVHV